MIEHLTLGLSRRFVFWPSLLCALLLGPLHVEARSPQPELAAGFPAVAARFDEEHRQLFTFTLDVPHEFVNLRAVVTADPPRVEAQRVPAANGSAAKPYATQPVRIDGQDLTAAVYDRAALCAGHRVAGPAIVTQMDTTTLVLPGHAADVDTFGNLLIRPET